MSDTDRSQALIELFKSAFRDHKQAFIETDGFDPEWPLWYADYLIQPLGELLGAQFTKSELVYLLVLLEKTQRLRAPGADWPRYYARFFSERYL